MSNRSVRHTCVFVVFSMSMTCLPRTSCAAEPARQFLDALANRGYHDTAVEYLEWLEQSGLSPEDFQDTIGYEQGNILLRAARRQQDRQLQKRDLGKAQTKFDDFLAKNGKHPRAVDARRGLRQIKVELARGLVHSAETSPAGKVRDRDFAKARRYFDEAAKSYEKRIAEVRDELKSIRAGNAKSSNRDELRVEYLQAKLASATVAYEVASTVKSDKKRYGKRLKVADKEFEELAEKYRTLLAGILSVYYRGKIQQDLGSPKKALTFYEEHIGEMNQPDVFRNVAAQATANAIQCWIDPQLKQYDHAIEVGENWIAAARPTDHNNAAWLALRMMVARAYRAKAEAASGDAASGSRINARKTAQFVSRFPGPTRNEARKFLAELGGQTAAVTEMAAVKTFAAARTAAMESRQELANNDTLVQLQTSKLASIKKAAARKEAEAQLAETQKRRDEQSQRATRWHQLALQLALDDTPVEQLNDLRYYLCYLLYNAGRHYEAAVLGDFIATHFPAAPGARTAANIGLASYAMIQNEAAQHPIAGQDMPDKSSNFIASRLEGLADHIVRIWPGQKEADEALITLVSFMVRDGRIDQAEKYLNKIPEDSPRRGDAEIRTGQALWASYLRNAAKDPEKVEVPEKVNEQLKRRAQAMLSNGIERKKKSTPTASLVRAVLSLAQLHLDQNDYPAAIELLEDKQIGPKTLADKKSPFITETPGLAELVYRVALRGYIGSSSMANVRSTMEALGKSVDDTPAGRRRLVGIYIGLAKDLRTQIEVASPRDRAALSVSFDKFLSHVSANTDEFNILNWVAATYSSMGDAFDVQDGQVSQQGRRFYEKSSEGYQQILALNDAGTLSLQENVVNTVRMRLASTQSRLGSYEQAVATFVELLSENNTMLNIQIEAARTLQAGAAAGKTEWYARAVMGDRRAGEKKPAIWGWGRISKIVAAQMYKSDAAKKRYGKIFFDARLQMAQCQYEQAARAKGDKRAKYLANAKKVLTSTAGIYPELGGVQSKSKYNQLLKDVQKTLGEPATGLDLDRRKNK